MTNISFSRDAAENREAVDAILDALEQAEGEIMTPVIAIRQQVTSVRLHVSLAPLRNPELPNMRLGELDIPYGSHDIHGIVGQIRNMLNAYLNQDISDMG